MNASRPSRSGATLYAISLLTAMTILFAPARDVHRLFAQDNGAQPAVKAPVTRGGISDLLKQLDTSSLDESIQDHVKQLYEKALKDLDRALLHAGHTLRAEGRESQTRRLARLARRLSR